MQTQYEPLMQATPIRVSMSYSEALNIVHALECIIPKGENFPNTNLLLSQLKNIVNDPYFD